LNSRSTSRRRPEPPGANARAPSHVIETRALPGRPLGMLPARFLRAYWQKRPLLIRGGFPQFHNAITPDDLAGLACEDGVLARIVTRKRKVSRSRSSAVTSDRDPWRVRNGPFPPEHFAKLPKKDWTLLVQDVDKWDGNVAALLDQFAFLPAWRIDDVMVSYAVDGGGVGAHVDNYDVFLVQTTGRRHWRISVDPAAPKDFRDDVELKLLRRFEPTHAWTLEPGDALYLPPGVPHDGIAVGECITCSVGMRAPSVAELIVDLAEAAAEPLDETMRYVDPDLTPLRDPHEIDLAAMQRVTSALAGMFASSGDDLRAWFGRFITRYRCAHQAVARARALTPGELSAKLAGAHLIRNPWSRAAWTRIGRAAELFVAGESYRCSLPVARLLAGARAIDGVRIGQLATARDWPIIVDLVNAGQYALSRLR